MKNISEATQKIRRYSGNYLRGLFKVFLRDSVPPW